MSQPLTQPTLTPTTQPDVIPMIKAKSASLPHEVHHKAAVDRGHYHPEMSTTARGMTSY